jgi:signal transduction histidine kinase
MEAPITSAYSAGALGSLHLVLDWRRFSEVLDRASREQGRMALVTDGAGATIAASGALESRRALAGASLADWLRTPDVAGEREGAPLSDSRVIEAGARFPPARGTGLGWFALIAQPTQQAFAPVQAMAGAFALLLVAIVAASVAAASWISRAISRPIVELTEFVRQSFARDASPVAPRGGSREVRELGEAFSAMWRDLQQSQAELVRATRMAAVGEMASMLAHEVRTPLGIMRSSAQMLRREPRLSGEAVELVGFIEAQTDRLNRLVSRMLHIARPRAAVRVPAEAAELVRGAVAVLAPQQRAKDITIDVEAAPGLGLQCDPDELTQVLLNLLANALHAVPPQGHVRIAARPCEGGIEITVDDNGPGVPQGERAEIFTAFVSRREGGMGLGLAIVREIVVAHGGTVEAGESEWGGARFRVWLPRTEALS